MSSDHGLYLLPFIKLLLDITIGNKMAEDCLMMEEYLMITMGQFISNFSIKTYVVGTQKCLTKALLMSTHNICFFGELEKIIPEFSPNTKCTPP